MVLCSGKWFHELHEASPESAKVSVSPLGKESCKRGQLWDRYCTEDESLDKQQSNRLQQGSGQ